MIEPYWTSKDGRHVVYCGDCIEILPNIRNVDLTITDPPYGISITKKTKNFGNLTELSRKRNNESWDDKIPTSEHFRLIFSVSDNQIVFGANYFWEYFYSTQCYIIWDKRGLLPSVPFCDTEFAWTSFRKMSKKYTIINHGFIRDFKEQRLHPTQKPVALLMAITSDFSETDATILDPFMGSGTTGVACVRLNRRFIGIEISKEYCDIAVERIKRELSQPRLELEPKPSFEQTKLFDEVE